MINSHASCRLDDTELVARVGFEPTIFGLWGRWGRPNSSTALRWPYVRPVAVGAPRTSHFSIGQHAFDIHPLFARDVIEFKHYRVRLAAGHATCSTPTEIRTPFPEVKTPDPNP